MSSPVAVIAAFLVFYVAVFVVLPRLTKRRIPAREDDLRTAAVLRGWTFERKTEGGYHIYRYTGTAEGVAWEAESAQPMAGYNHEGQERRNVARWHGKWSPGVTAPIVAFGVPKGKEGFTRAIAQGDGYFARLAVKIAGFAFNQALDVYFGDQIGKEIDAASLRRVESAAVPGFIIMAGDVDEASRILSEGLQRALVEASSTPGHLLAEKDRPFVLVWQQGISLARMRQFRDVADVERFTQAGMGLTRAFRFGRPL
jgi:hypothetical protein